MEPGFRGSYLLSVDDKARIVIPVPARQALDKKVVLVYGFDECVAGMSKEGWEAMLERGAAREHEWPTAFRRMIGTAVEVQREESNRISIPEHFLEYCGLRRRDCAVFLGLGRRFEIWNRDRHQEYARKMHVAPLASEVAREFGFTELM